MKLKIDFITNSSSASFILYIESDTNDIEKFKELWDKYLNFFIQENREKVDKWVEKRKEWIKKDNETKIRVENKIKNGEELTIFEKYFGITDIEEYTDEELEKLVLGNINIIHTVGNVFEVIQWTSMYNGEFDKEAPEWMVYLIKLYNDNAEKIKKDFGFKELNTRVEEDN